MIVAVVRETVATGPSKVSAIGKFAMVVVRAGEDLPGVAKRRKRIKR